MSRQDLAPAPPPLRPLPHPPPWRRPPPPLPLALLFLPWPHWSARAKREALLFTSPAFLWLAVMTTRPHKEERFLFPIYPLLALAAALTVHGVVIALVEVAASVGA